MPVKGIERVKSNFRVAVTRIAEGVTERAVRELLSHGGAAAAQLTPVDTGTLINSQYAPLLEVSKGKVTGSVGYTAAYAANVHDAPGVHLTTNTPRDPSNPSRGDIWDPNAEPGFLTEGFEQLKPAIPAILRKHYRV